MPLERIARVELKAGHVMLWTWEQVGVGIGFTQSTRFACNLEPVSWDVDLGNQYGVPVPAVSLHIRYPGGRTMCSRVTRLSIHHRACATRA